MRDYDDGYGDDDRPTRREAERDDILDEQDGRGRFYADEPTEPAVVADGARGIRCGACKARHATAADVRWCYDLKREGEAEAQAEQAAEAASERAYARSREAQAEAGTWFGPQTEADRWGEDDDALDAQQAQRARTAVIHTGLDTGSGDCAGGVCEDINRLCSKHQQQYQGRFGRASNE